MVVKPTISGGGFRTARYEAHEHERARQHVAELVGSGRTAMVQPYQEAVDAEGEVGLIFLGGTFSHAIHKGPMIRRGVGAVDSLIDNQVVAPVRPSAAQLELGRLAVGAAEGLLGPTTYARVDVVPTAGGAPPSLSSNSWTRCCSSPSIPLRRGASPRSSRPRRLRAPSRTRSGGGSAALGQSHRCVRLEHPEAEALLDVQPHDVGIVVQVADGEILAAVEDEVAATEAQHDTAVHAGRPHQWPAEDLAQVVEQQVPPVLGGLDNAGVDLRPMARPYGPPMPARRSTSTAWATTLGYCSMSSENPIGACELHSVMPSMPASA